jgi:hypothetical protein
MLYNESHGRGKKPHAVCGQENRQGETVGPHAREKHQTQEEDQEED